MTLLRVNPARSFLNMNRMFEDFFPNDEYLQERLHPVVPVINVEENEDSFNISAEIPGMKKNDIKISFQDNMLTISGEKQEEKKRKGRNYHRIERNFGKFSRSINIPADVRADKISAEYEDGVLYISIPKSEEARPKLIEVKVK